MNESPSHRHCLQDAFAYIYLFTFYFFLKSAIRHALAALHFNENLKRQTRKTEEGQDYFKVTYPKFKLGEELVRDVAIPPRYSKWV